MLKFIARTLSVGIRFEAGHDVYLFHPLPCSILHTKSVMSIVARG